MTKMETVFTLVGGLGIFLFGIKYMGEGLKQYAGEKLKGMIQKYTNNPVKGVLVGMLSTIAIQSSSGTTALTISLVRAGLMTFRQSIGVIMGANIGTTITAFIIGLKISDYALPIIAVGGIIYMFSKQRRTRSLSEIIIGFGMLFLGLSYMSAALKPIAQLDFVAEIMIELSETPFLGLIVGTISTFIIQSSSAVIGIVQTLYGDGSIQLTAAIALALGSNIGTTITAFIASLGGSAASKRASLFHILFNTIGATLFLIIIHPYVAVIAELSNVFNLNPEMQIALAHGIFNVAITLLMLPFTKKVEVIIKKLIKSKDDEFESSDELFNKDLPHQSPSLALVQAKKSLIYMGKVVVKNLEGSRIFLFQNKLSALEDIYQLEMIIDSLDSEMQSYLQLIAEDNLSENETIQHRILMMSSKSFERIGDHLINIVQFINVLIENKERLKNTALEDFETIYNYAVDICKITVDFLETDEDDLANKVIKLEEKIDDFEQEAIKRHYDRLRKVECKGIRSGIYVDLLNNVERIGDHACTIINNSQGREKSRVTINFEKVEDVIN